MMSLHRFRSAYIAQRTARINAARGVLREIGIFIPQGASRLLPAVHELTADPDSVIPAPMRLALIDACADIRGLETRIRNIEHQLKDLAKNNHIVNRLLTIPGIGLLSATALLAFVGDMKRFPSARHFASYLGLTPREHSSGQRRHLGSISKRGDTYIRMLLVHGARSVLWASKKSKNPDRLRRWALKTESRRGHNKAAVALANKLARIVWAVWNTDHPFESTKEAG